MLKLTLDKSNMLRAYYLSKELDSYLSVK